MTAVCVLPAAIAYDSHPEWQQPFHLAVGVQPLLAKLSL